MKMIAYVLLVLTLGSCTRDTFDLHACITMDKNSAKIGDTIVFYNCTKWGKYPDRYVTYDFGDQQSIRDTIADSVQHIYQSKGNFLAKIYIGGPHTKGGTYSAGIKIE